MSREFDATAAAVARAVSGPDSPEAVRVTRPDHRAVWTLFAIAGALVALDVFAVASLTWAAPWTPASEAARAHWIGWTAVINALGLGVVVFAIASPWVGQVKAEAGPSGGVFSIGGRPDPATVAKAASAAAGGPAAVAPPGGQAAAAGPDEDLFAPPPASR